MKWQAKCNIFIVKTLMATVLVCLLAVPSFAETNLQELIGRANDQVAKFVELFSDVKCTEHVTQ